MIIFFHIHLHSSSTFHKIKQYQRPSSKNKRSSIVYYLETDSKFVPSFWHPPQYCHKPVSQAGYSQSPSSWGVAGCSVYRPLCWHCHRVPHSTSCGHVLVSATQRPVTTYTVCTLHHLRAKAHCQPTGCHWINQRVKIGLIWNGYLDLFVHV